MSSHTLPQSICILGRQPALGIAELESLFGADAVADVTPTIAGLAIPAADVDFTRLGGSTRLARVLADVPSKLWKDVEKQLSKSLVEVASALPDGKLQLGISAFGIPVTPAKITATGLTLKKIVRGKAGRSLRLTPNNELELNTAQVLHNHLTGPTGIEFLVVATDNGHTLIAQTIAVQDIESYSERDRGRPKRDARVGMLPPKLAQIIINLAVGKMDVLENKNAETTTVLDPFCGTGVILQEALLMGFNVYGTDLEQRMVEFSSENLEWFKSGQKITGSSKVDKGDASDYTWQSPISIVASETYLGRAFTDHPSAELIAQTNSEVNLILKKFLRNIHGQLQPGTPLCLAVPAWQTTPGSFKHLPLIDQLNDLGYNRMRFEHVRDEDLLYYRTDQTVARELLVLTRK